MEVDRISRMSGVDHEQTPAWTRNKLRRRKFTEEVEPAETEQQEAETAESSDPGDDARTLDLMA
jgi:hypothetical protein